MASVLSGKTTASVPLINTAGTHHCHVSNNTDADVFIKVEVAPAGTTSYVMYPNMRVPTKSQVYFSVVGLQTGGTVTVTNLTGGGALDVLVVTS